jgi:hypothetical protein
VGVETELHTFSTFVLDGDWVEERKIEHKKHGKTRDKELRNEKIN